jgi:hypothetical protein
MDPVVDIAFDCLPLRCVGRVDVPIDASTGFRARLEHLQRSIEAHGVANSYFLYNARCVYRLANSDIEGMLRFSFEGTVLTDASDAKAATADLQVALIGETCGGIPPEVQHWLVKRVERAVLVEFDRFITAGQLAERVGQLGHGARVSELADFAGMNL